MRKADNLPPYRAVVMKSGSLNFVEPSGPAQACYGRTLPFTMPSYYLAKLLLNMDYSSYSVSELGRDIPEDAGFVCVKAAVLRDTVNGTFCIFHYILKFSNLLLLLRFYNQNVVCISHCILMSFVFRPSHPL